MSLESVQTIIGRAMTELEYRELLFNNPDKALEGFELTDEETNALTGLERVKFDEVSSELEERISRAGISPMTIIDNGDPGFRLSIDGGENWTRLR